MSELVGAWVVFSLAVAFFGGLIVAAHRHGGSRENALRQERGRRGDPTGLGRLSRPRAA